MAAMHQDIDITAIQNDPEVKRLKATLAQTFDGRFVTEAGREARRQARLDLTTRVLALLEVQSGAEVGVLTYSSNNSGGHWWLSESDWAAMEADGWVLHFDRSNAYGDIVENITPSIDRSDGFLGAHCRSASIVTADPDATVRQWEASTGQDAGAEGCNCCGQPHDFSYIDPKGRQHFADIIVTSTFGGFS